MPIPFQRFRLLNNEGGKYNVSNYGPHPIDVSYDGELVHGHVPPGESLPLDPVAPDVWVRSQHPEETSDIALHLDG